MKITPKIAAAAMAALTLGGAGTGTAVAASHSGAAPAAVTSAEPTSPDHDSLQQGDQTTPDAASALTATGTSSPEPSSPEADSTTENESAPPDGPGGHADPSGTVQHEFSGVE